MSPGRPGVPARARRVAGVLRRRIRSFVDAGLHERRRRAARSLLRSLPPPGSVLFVCLGNICRSPYAAFRFRELLKEGVGPAEILSGGFIGPDREPPPHALDVAERRGLDMSGHRSRLVTREMIDETDLFVVMEPGQIALLRRKGLAGSSPVIVLGDLDPEPVTRRAVPDPWGHDLEVFREVFQRIDRCVEALAEELGGARRRGTEEQGAGDGVKDGKTVETTGSSPGRTETDR